MATWSIVDNAVDSYQIGLALEHQRNTSVVDAPPGTNGVETRTTWHVVFRCGTIVRVEFDNNDDEFEGYGEEPTFPTSRFANETDRKRIHAMRHNVWDQQKDTKGELGRALRIAFKTLIEAGYPAPGTSRSDRTVRLLPQTRRQPQIRRQPAYWLGTWQRAPNILSLACATTTIAAHLQCGELRRYDHICPIVHCYIKPDGFRADFTPVLQGEDTA